MRFLRPSRLLALCLLAPLCLSRADVSLPPIFSDHAVLQKGQATAIWGRAEPGEFVSISFGDISAKTSADFRR